MSLARLVGNSLTLFAIIGLLLVVAPARAETPLPSIRLNQKTEKATIDVLGLSKATLADLARLDPDSEKWQHRFVVYVDREKRSDDQPAILGTYRIDKGVLRFEPRYALQRGIRYRAVYRPDKGKPIETIVSLPRPALQATTTIARVYPTTDRVPENLLKFYLHFSAPMTQGESYQHIKLLDEKGKAVDLPFLELDQELWDPSGKRFTLFFDPGRIKRGLKPREEVGPALVEGKRYTLVIDRAWADARGNPLKETFRKSFTVLAPDDRSPDIKTWKLTPPLAGTRAPLRVTFPKSMDHALAERMVWVVDAMGKKLPGNVETTDRETVWQFTPQTPWRTGTFDLVADTRLEDLAGNSLGRPFEVDVLRPVERTIKKETVKVRFSVKK
jgi:hypothetical protein